jgi:hypothetical protein
MRGSYLAVAITIALAAAYAGSNSAPSTSFAEPQLSSEDGKSPASVTVIDAADARGILGREVRTAADENMGRIVDVVVDRAGQVRASIIDFGGFLGVGSRKIAVDWSALRFTRVVNKGDSIILELTREQVKAAPEYKEGKPIVVLGSSGSLEPLRFVAPLTPEK